MSTPFAETRIRSLLLDDAEPTASQLRGCKTRRPADGVASDDSQPKRQKRQSDIGLCPACSKIDFDEVFRKADAHFAAQHVNGGYTKRFPMPPPECLFIVDLGDRPAQPGNCSMCYFFAAVRGPDTSGPYQLCAFSSAKCNPFLKTAPGPTLVAEIAQNAFLAVAPVAAAESPLLSLPASWHPIYRVLPGNSARIPPGIWAKELRPSVDFSAVKAWSSFCKKHHRGICVLAKHQMVKTLPGFRLIDCDSSSRDVLDKPPTEKYAALSYVWGEEAVVPGSWPKVVLDAILVTRKLGLRYLWVDRFCIDQEDAQTKHSLIAKMAVIYQNAEFTIIAAAGSGANHGLPGVGMTRQKPQPKVQIGQTVLASPLENCREDIYQSTWWTRGWTYQEGVLARRRIVFTERQVYWECGGMVTWEAIHLPLKSLHAKHKIGMGHYKAVGVFSGSLRGVFYGGDLSGALREEETLLRITEHIRNFSGRNLKFPTDSLLAMQGILKHYTDSNRHLGFLQGLPMSSKVPSDLERPGHSRLRSFAAALTSWAHTDNSGQVQRLSHLPSWTWAGWKGQVTWEFDRVFGVDYDSAISDALSEYSRSDPGWATDICLRLSKGETQSLVNLSQYALLDSDFDGMLRIPQPYVLQRRDLLVIASEQPWIAYLEGHTVSLCLSTCDAVVVSENEPIKAVKGDLLLVLILLTGKGFRGKTARFLVVRPAPLSGVEASEQITHYERIGAAWIKIPQPDGSDQTAEDVIQKLPIQRMGEDIAIC